MRNSVLRWMPCLTRWLNVAPHVAHNKLRYYTLTEFPFYATYPACVWL
jgi:hypothetical protein